jgi:hypothetical protein
MSSPTRKRTSSRYAVGLTLFGLLLSLVISVAGTAPQLPGAKFEIRHGVARPGTDDPPLPVLRVSAKKNKQVYDTVEPVEGGLRFLIKVRGQCGSEGSKNHLHRGEVALFSGTKATGRETFSVDKSHRSIGADHGQGWNYYTVAFPYISPRRSPVELCNNELDRREGLGENRVALLQKGFDADLPTGYEAELIVTCMEDQGLGFKDVPWEIKNRSSLPVAVRCAPTGYVPTGGAPAKPGVKLDPFITSINLAAEPAESRGHACPVQVSFRGRITAGENRPGNDLFKIKYRFVGDRNFATDFYEETLRKGETKAVFWKRRIEAPAIGGRDKIATPGVQPKIPIYQGWTRLEVVYPEGTKLSDKAAFTVDCNPVPQRVPPRTGPRIKPRNE